MVDRRSGSFAAGMGAFLSVLLLGGGAAFPEVQGLGTFTWRLFPFCNVLTLTIVADGPLATVAGFDNRCGGPQRQAATGSAFPNPDGTVGIGLTVLGPAGRPSHLSVVLNAGSSSGTWQDDAGNEGAFLFNPAIPAGGSPRPTATGLGTLEIVRTTSAGGSGEIQTAVASCPTGKQVIGGGYARGGFNTTPIEVPFNFPEEDLSGWRVMGWETAPTNESWAVEAFAVCARVGP